MMKNVWRVALLVALLAGSLVVLSMTGGWLQPAMVRAERLKTTEEPLDPACNALGKLRVDVSPMEREEFSDENGGMIQACRYEVTLTNTDDTYAIRVFTNGSGSVDRGEQIFHTRHNHKQLDPGESYSKDMYVIVYPDGTEESFFYTYFKATYNDLDFPKDCRPTVDHFYTWDLPYRLVDTPCLDLSTDPPEIVEWSPPEGLAVEPSGESSSGETSGGESGGETALGETDQETGPEDGSESSQPQTEDQQLTQQGQDLVNQLAELLVMGGLGNLDQWEGWSGLNENQRANLLAIIDRLNERAEEYLTPDQQAALNAAEAEEAREQRMQDELAQRIKEKAEDWERLEIMINRERASQMGDWALAIYDNYRAAQPLVEGINWIRSWYDTLANKEDWAKDKADSYLQEHTGTSVEDAAVAILKETVSLANLPVQGHYAYYLDQYERHVSEKMSHDEAHAAAMQDLRDAFAEPPQDGQGILKDDIWQSVDKDINAAKGGIYDRLFDKLNGRYDPRIKP